MLISAGRLSQLTLALAVALAISPSFAQSQASGVAGRLVDASGVPTADVEITVTHVQSGTIARTRTDAQGRYQVSGLRVGGPYTVSAAGLRSVDGVYLFLDRLEEVDFTTPRIADLDSVVVTAHPLLVGTGTSLNATQLAQLPSIDRSLTDYVRLDPRFAAPAFELGMISFRDRDYPTSILWLTKIRREDPDYLEANFFLGLAYLYREQYERAATAFRVVEQQLPLNEVYNNLGIALLRQERPGAAPYFEKAVESDPEDPVYQFNLGYAYW